MTRRALALLALAALLVAACTGAGGDGDDTAGGKVDLEVWFHDPDGPERRLIEQQVDRFNLAQDDVLVRLRLLAEGGFDDQVLEAADAGDLPEIVSVDGGLLAVLADRDLLVDLNPHLGRSLRRELLPWTFETGVVEGRLVGLPATQAVTILLGRRDALEATHVRLPTRAHRAWTAEEFAEVLARLAADDEDGHVLDLRLRPDGAPGFSDWPAFALTPLLRSAGGGLVAPLFTSASDVLDGPESVRAMVEVQRWAAAGWLAEATDADALAEGTVPLVWADTSRHAALEPALGEEVVVLPLPDLGRGTRSSRGWNSWAVSAGTDVEAALAFLTFLLSPAEQALTIEATHGIPATRSALGEAALFDRGGPLALVRELVESGAAEPRPRGVAYRPTAERFADAVREIIDGAPVFETLDVAATDIDEIVFHRDDG